MFSKLNLFTKRGFINSTLGLGMVGYYYSSDIGTYVLKKMDPENAHNLTISLLSKGILPYTKKYESKRLNNKVAGYNLNNPVGLAAGFDKNAKVYNQLFKLGFSSVEIGSITPYKQKGNLKPRIFRYDDCIINHCGLNNHGSYIIRNRLSKSNINNNDEFVRREQGKLLGISISKNNNSKNQIKDFIKNINNLQDYSDYMVLNISCPNVDKFDLDINEILEITRSICKKPLFIKLSPDLSYDEYFNIGDLCIKNNIDGIILTNTLKSSNSKIEYLEKGGISGSDELYTASNNILKNMYSRYKDKLIFVGCGGILTPEQAYEKIKFGASFIQIYSGFIYSGPNIIYDINKYIDNQLEKEGFENIKDAVGSSAGI